MYQRDRRAQSIDGNTEMVALRAQPLETGLEVVITLVGETGPLVGYCTRSSLGLHPVELVGIANSSAEMIQYRGGKGKLVRARRLRCSPGWA